jgi:hypothetical protein
MAAEVQELIDQLNQLKADRGTWDAHVDEIVENIIPFRQRVSSKLTPGAKAMDKIMDSSPTHALLLWGAGLCGMLTNASVPWYTVTTEDPALADDQEVKWYLDIVKTRFEAVFNKANFYNQIHEVYLDIGSLGTGPLFVGEHPRHICHFKAVSPGECYISTSQYDVVDTLFRVFTMTARQMAQKWGENKVSDKVRENLKTKPFNQIEVCHAVYPRKLRDSNKIDNQNKPYACVYFETESKQKLNESGYNEFPYMVPRFFVMSGETYGRGPGEIALPDVKMLNRMEKDILASGQKKLSPPLLLPDDGIIGQLRLIPNGLNFYRGDTDAQKVIGVFPTADDLGYAEQKLDQKRNQIRNIFYNDMLQLVHDQDMTATEVLKRIEEKLRLMGPLLGRLQSELYNLLFDRMFEIMLRNQVLPIPPQVLWGANLKIDYISPLAKAQRVAEADGISRTMQQIALLAQADPSVLDNFDLDGTAKDIAEINGFPLKRIRDPKQVQEIRAQRAQQQQQQQQAMALAEAADKIPALSQEPGAGSPMDMLMNMGRENMQ